MSLETLRRTLCDYYKNEVNTAVQQLHDRVYARLDDFDRTHPNQNAYRLKAEQYTAIADLFEPKLFFENPFWFETGGFGAFGDGCYNRTLGAAQANGWIMERNEHKARENNEAKAALFHRNMSDILYLDGGSGFDCEHSPIPLKKIFSVGLSGIYDEATEALSCCESEEERDFVHCALTGLMCLKKMSEKFAKEAERLLEKTKNETERKNLLRIAETAKRVPWNPPQNFYEGLETLAFMRKALGSLEGYGYNSMGRPDLLLFPLLEKSRETGESEEELYDLLCRFLLIWDCPVDRDKIMAGYGDYEYENSVAIGGVDRGGNEVFNDIDRMLLRAAVELNLLYPKIMCRFGSGSSEEYLRAITDPLMHGKNILLFENDDVMIPAKTAAGYALDDARDYIVSGCWDATIGDLNKDNGGEYFNLLRVMEWSVHMPQDKLSENGLPFKPLSDAQSFEEVYSIFLHNTELLIRQKAALSFALGKHWKEISPLCLTSALMRNPLKNRRDISNGGTGYARETMNFCGFPDVVDSLSAIKKMCFEDKVLTLAELIRQCKLDFPDEALRMRLTKCPSFGDGSPDSCALAARLNADLYRLTRSLPTLFGGEYSIGYFMYTEVLHWGKKIAATPNGRKSGYYIAHGITPTRLKEIRSVTDVLRSVKAMKLQNCAANSILNVMLPAAKLTEEQLAGFVRACALCGVEAIQVNCVNREELLAAQKEPDRYRHILVRVTGFSCPFVSLSEEWQKEVLSRNYYES